MNINATPDGWNRCERPPNLFRRFQFASYTQTRTFLDLLADLSKETGYYPDIGFGTTYANITVSARNGSEITDDDMIFASRTADLAHGVASDK